MTAFDYIATRNELIRDALEIVGALDTYEPMTAEMLAQGVRSLQLLTKHWNNKHVFLWAHNQFLFSTVAAQEVYTSELDPEIIGIDKAYVRNVGELEDIPLEVISWSEYWDIQDKETDTGRPKVLAFKSTPAPSVYLWPNPDDSYTVRGLAVYALEDFDSASGSGDIPVRFQQALLYGLADKLFDKYPGSMNSRQFIESKAAQYFAEAKAADIPSETTSEVAPLYSNRRY